MASRVVNLCEGSAVHFRSRIKFDRRSSRVRATRNGAPQVGYGKMDLIVRGISVGASASVDDFAAT